VNANYGLEILQSLKFFLSNRKLSETFAFLAKKVDSKNLLTGQLQKTFISLFYFFLRTIEDLIKIRNCIAFSHRKNYYFFLILAKKDIEFAFTRIGFTRFLILFYLW